MSLVFLHDNVNNTVILGAREEDYELRIKGIGFRI